MAQFASTLYPQTNPTNPILLELRKDWEGDAAGCWFWVGLVCANLIEDSVQITQAQVDHARRVLDRLARLARLTG